MLSRVQPAHPPLWHQASQYLAGLQLQSKDLRLWPCKVVCKGPKHHHLNCSKRHNGLYCTRTIFSELWGDILQVRCVQFWHAGVRNGEWQEKFRPKYWDPEWGLPPRVDLWESDQWAGVGAYFGNNSRRERKIETPGYCGPMVYSVEPKKPAINDQGCQHVNREAT